jgi:hypothetical protein
MKSRGNELEVSGGTVGSGGAATAVLSTGAQVVGKGREKRVTEEQGIEWKGEKRREKIGSGVGRERESSTSHDVVDCAVPVVDG